jgi:hypothetical protein
MVAHTNKKVIFELQFACVKKLIHIYVCVHVQLYIYMYNYICVRVSTLYLYTQTYTGASVVQELYA